MVSPNDYNFHRMPNLTSCQYLDDEIAKAIDRWIGYMLRVVGWILPSFREQQKLAQQQIERELEQYHEYLCSFAPDDDVPF